jgi:hypothetical protein
MNARHFPRKSSILQRKQSHEIEVSAFEARAYQRKPGLTFQIVWVLPLFFSANLSVAGCEELQMLLSHRADLQQCLGAFPLLLSQSPMKSRQPKAMPEKQKDH